jgi:hypothetical protein
MLAAGAALLALAAAGCADPGQDSDPEHRSFPLDGRRLTVKADDSSVEIRPADVDEVEVTRWFDAWTVLGGKRPEVKWSMEGSTLRLTVRCGVGLINDCAARHRVLVPRGVAVAVDAENGSVTASGFTTALDLDSGNGRVVVRDSSGELRLSSDNGSVKATGVRSPRVDADADNGRVELRFAKVPDVVRAESDNGAVRIHLPRAEYRVDAKASNGSVRVGVPRDDGSRHSVTAKSANGSVSLRLNGG